MTRSMLHIRSLSKSFDDAAVISGLDLDVADGSTTAVVGPSGCGKTTLLRIIAGFERPDHGTVAIAGTTVAGPECEVAPHRRGVGYVTQDGALFPHLTVGGNIAYGLGSLRNAAVRERVDRLLRTVSLDTALAERRPDELSGGQQQRVALARALACKPTLMLLDEPFSSLDARLRVATRNSVAEVLVEAAVSTLLVTHDQQEALSIADRVAVMLGGRFTQVGTPQEVYRLPADRPTAEFLGDCVFIPCTVTGGTAQCALGRIPVHSTGDGPGTLMLRPEQLRASAVRDRDQTSATGIVTAMEFLGGEVVLTVDVGAGENPLAARQSSFDSPTVHAKVRIDVIGHGVVFRSDRG